MIRITYKGAPVAPPGAEVWLDGSTPAVLAEPYLGLDEGQGGVTRSDLRDEDLRPLDTFKPGDEIFVESDAADDVLDDSTDETEQATRIYWRAVVLDAR